MVKNKLNQVEFLNVILLLFLYTLVYAISVVTRVNSSEFMGVDPQSIVAAINQLTTPPYYNMNEPYHSQYYGWTYFSLNFVVIFIAKCIGFGSEFEINVLIRSVIFIIGACLVLSLYLFSREIFSKLVSFFLVLYFMFDPVVSHYITLIHPESLGMTLQIVGCYFLIRFYKSGGKDSWKFYLSIVLLSLSSLAKQPFFIVNFVIGFVYLKFLSDKLNFSFKSIIGLFFRSVLVFLVCFFIIHPYAFIEFDRFITAQLYLSSNHSLGDMSEVLNIWFSEYTKSLLFSIHTLVFFIVAFSKNRNKYHFISLISVSLVVALFMYQSRIFISLGYLFPLYLLAFVNVSYFIVGCFERNTLYSKSLVFVALVFICINFISNFSFSVFSNYNKYYTDGLATKNKIWDYIKTLPENKKIAYSPNIAMPQPYKLIGCHAWQGCAKSNDLARYDPDIIIYSPGYYYFESEDYTDYIKKNGFNLIKTVSPTSEIIYSCGSTSAVGEDKPTFHFFNIPFVMSNVSKCIDGYELSKIQKENSRLMGLEILVYRK
ncbi:glycosyltransferase family 39 protein [Vibrio pectenicida]|uniref:glycosyltransferase family 39 protein n=1 Tax=Vibrio pectenicida TaxID=62763 RepID=UPI003B9A8DD7